MTVANYEIHKLHAQYFSGPTSDSDHGFRTVPMLLRAIADWMDQNDIQDPEFDHLLVKVMFSGDDSDNFRETATLYYLESPEKKFEEVR